MLRGVPRVAGSPQDAPAGTQRKPRNVLDTACEQLGLARLRVRFPRAHGRSETDRHGVGVEQDRCEVDAGDPVHKRVVGLADQRELVVLEALHEPHLPERLRPVEPLREDPPDQERELVLVARRGQRRVAYVILEVEPRVVHPDGTTGLEWREGELLPVTRDQMEPRRDVVGELVIARRRALEHAHAADVHVRGLVLLSEEAGVCRAEPVEVGDFRPQGLPVPTVPKRIRL